MLRRVMHVQANLLLEHSYQPIVCYILFYMPVQQSAAVQAARFHHLCFSSRNFSSSVSIGLLCGKIF